MDQNIKIKKENLLLAFLFSFLVLVGGAVLWGVLYYYGVFTSWVSFIASFGAVALYNKFYSKIDWKVYVWVIAISLVLNTVSMFLALILAVIAEVGYTFGEAFDFIMSLFEPETEFLSAFISDMVYNVLFTLIGVIIPIVIKKRNLKRQKEQTEKLNQINSQLSEQNEEPESVSQENNQESQNNQEERKVNYDTVFEQVLSIVNKYMENHDKQEFNVRIIAIKKSIHDQLTKQEIETLKNLALEKQQINNLSNAELVSIDIIKKL